MEDNWNAVWDCILSSFQAIYRAMNTIKILDVWGNNYISLWDFCIGIIVMGAIINLFINFTVPTIPDKSSLKRKPNKKE